jgi:hypothetical protein
MEGQFTTVREKNIPVSMPAVNCFKDQITKLGWAYKSKLTKCNLEI